MRKITILITLVIVSLNMFSQSWTFSNTLMGDGNISVLHSIIDNNGSVIVNGYFDNNIISSTGESINTAGLRDYFLAKFDNQGDLVWLKSLGGTQNEDILGDIAIDSDNNIYIAGGYKDYLKYSPTDSIISTGLFDAFLAKYSPSGSVIFFEGFGVGNGPQRASALEIDQNGDVILSGTFRDSIRFMNDTTIYSNNSYWNQYIVKVNADDARIIWAQGILSINNSFGSRTDDIIASNHEYFFEGVYKDSIIFGNDTIVSIGGTQDSYLLKTSSSGDYLWVREFRGDDLDIGFSLSQDPEDNIYFVGHYNSLSLSIDSTDSITKDFDFGSVSKGFEFFIVKYNNQGTLQWVRFAGGNYDDVLVHSEFFDDEINVSGYFTDSINWGGINLRSNGPLDKDMFVGALDTEGNYRSANSYGGVANSEEEARATFSDGTDLYTVIRSNSTILQLGDSIYVSSNGMYYIALGIIGCNPISIDNVITQDIQTCYGDSTGAIQILATGGFGAPWQYSIDNGLIYQDIAYFADLPAGDYPIVIIDKEGCAQPGPMETVSQPDPLSIELISDDLIDGKIEIVVTAAGGSPPYTYTLQPDGIIQGFGTFNVEWNDTSNYFVEVNDLNNCGPVATDTLTTSSGIELTAPGVKLYPNPTSGMITLEMPFEGAEATLEVLSLMGQVMVSRQVYSSGGMINETFDISDLAKGMYMIRVEGQTLRSGVIVN